MALDTSIYGNLRQIQQPDVLDSATKAMSFGQLALQSRQAQQADADQQAVRAAFGQNMGADGSVNRAGVLGQLAKTAPMQAMNYKQQFAQQDAAQADAQNKLLGDKINQMGLAAQMAMSAKDQGSYEGMLKQMQGMGLDTSHMPAQFDPGLMRQYALASLDQKQRLEGMKGTSEIDINQAKAPLERDKLRAEAGQIRSNTALAPAKLASELYGSRSPNAEVTSQYDKQAAPIRSSQMAMQQMLDNYKNTTPQGDASLVLNAFKIKFPNAPDVNSLAELQHSEGATQQMKNWFSEKLEGVKDPEVRADLLRDGISTFRANVEGLRATQGKYLDKARHQGIPGATDIVAEPAIDQTYGQAMKLQDEVGPYVKPSDRPGKLAGLRRFAEHTIGMGENTANAASLPPVPKGFIRMKDPTGVIRNVPASQKGEAIAAGGSVL